MFGHMLLPSASISLYILRRCNGG